jgi:hypothetical protein
MPPRCPSRLKRAVDVVTGADRLIVGDTFITTAEFCQGTTGSVEQT